MDASWYEKLLSDKLYIKIQVVRKTHPYAILYKREDGKTKYVKPLHAWIKGVDTKANVVDHINFDTLDCRELNLRICTDTENKRRAEKIRNKTGKLGVYHHHDNFEACVVHNGEKHRMFGFDNVEEAAKARDALAKELHGDTARLNTDKISRRTIEDMQDTSINTRPNRFGVGIISKGNKFMGQVVINKRKYYTARFYSVEDATKARQRLIEEISRAKTVS